MIEMNRSNIKIDQEIDIDPYWYPPMCVSAYVETWFDVNEKFGLHIPDDDSTWVNLYAIYNPHEDLLFMEYYVETDSSSSGPFSYTPTDAERQTIIEMVEEKCMEVEELSCVDTLKKYM